ncbi:MAG: hypothetical protein SGPRY_007945 [Prymnesium sp.]
MRQGGRWLQRKLFPWMLRWASGAFKKIDADACIFVAREGEDLLIMAVYVDDACRLYREEGAGSLYARFYADFHAAWEAEDDGELCNMLNIQYEYGEGTLKLHQ